MDSQLAAVSAVTISGAIVCGLVLAFLGSIKLHLSRRLDLGERQVAGLLASLNLALIPMMLLSGVLCDGLGARWVLFGGSLVTAAGLFTMSHSPTYVRALFAVLLIGLGAASANTATVVLMWSAFFEGRPEAAVNLGHVFIALGALITPALTDVLFRTIDYRRTVGLLAALCLTPALLCLLPLGGYVDEVSKGGQWLPPMDDYTPALWMACLVSFFYVPLEGAVSVWSTTYLRDLETEESRKRLRPGWEAWVLTGFWTFFLLSRLLVAWLSSQRWSWTDNWGWFGVLITVPAVLTAVTLGNLAGTASRASGRRGLLLVGLLLGPIFPTLLVMVFSQHQEHRGAVYGLVFALGSIGSLMLAPLFGARTARARARDQSVQVAFRMPMWIALVLAGAALAFALAGGTR